MASIEQAREAKAALKQALAGQDGVTGIGLRHEGADAAGRSEAAKAQSEATDTWCLQVNVVDAAASGDVPQEVDGVAVVVRVTGRIERSG
ncbi:MULTISPECIES: hypothetical protein [Oerskovia]|uniref:Uncharacterized protein n=1 Tax=Oerskovia rustica TaxID=2762237 RepID=A0ABR8RUK3_9CELL|nr:hypothetical protein [Oerskovia rustica]MBD7951470.1 hypothetical protein [Oerskovia rustica]